MTRFLHVTDLHITAPQTEDPTQQTNTVAAFEKLLLAAERLKPKPEFMVFSGDLTNIGDEASYRWLSDRLARTDIPVVMTLGNHDRRAPWHAVFPGHMKSPDGSVDHDIVLSGLHVIALDSMVPGKISGALTDEQLQYAEEMLNRHPSRPKVLAIHHPPKLNRSTTFAWASLDVDSTDRLAALIGGRNIAAVLSGHVHMNRFAIWQGVPLVINTGLQSSIDATRTDALSVIEGAGFAVCDHLDGNLQVTFASLDEPRPIKEISVERLRAFS